MKIEPFFVTISSHIPHPGLVVSLVARVEQYHSGNPRGVIARNGDVVEGPSDSEVDFNLYLEYHTAGTRDAPHRVALMDADALYTDEAMYERVLRLADQAVSVLEDPRCSLKGGDASNI